MVLCVLVSCLVVALGGASWAADVKPPAIKAEVKAVGPFEYVCYECKGSYASFAQMEKAFLDEFKKSGIAAAGPQITLYWNSPLYVKPEALLWDIGFPVKGVVKVSGNLKLKKFTYQNAAITLHTGSYATTGVTTDALYAWIAEKKLPLAGGPCVERYLDPTPDKVPDAQKRTEILVPLK